MKPELPPPSRLQFYLGIVQCLEEDLEAATDVDQLSVLLKSADAYVSALSGPEGDLEVAERAEVLQALAKLVAKLHSRLSVMQRPAHPYTRH